MLCGVTRTFGMSHNSGAGRQPRRQRTIETAAAESGLIPGEVDYSGEAGYVRDVSATGTRNEPE
jgi:hypothetical protein